MSGIRNEYLQLLREWLDALMTFTLNDPSHPSLDGAIICPACTLIHGRCHEAVYPLMTMADLTGNVRYLDAARKLFKWSSFMLCDDGSLYNDSQSAWNGITVFAAVGLVNALRYHGRLLTNEEKAEWENRLRVMALWLRDGIGPDDRFNINYIAANAAAMALIGRYFNDGAMIARARQLADFSFGRISENGLVYGEGSLRRNATPRGQCASDVGYSVEETLPSLFEYARVTGDESAMAAVKKAVRSQLDLMLPDGAWDNSFGTRNFKWTYWGSRTSDGCQAMLNEMGKSESVFAEAAYRNLMLYRRCTRGLLYGGPHYLRHGENACVHHAFCHAKVLAQALDEGVAEFSRTSIPSDDPDQLKAYPEVGTFRLSRGPWRMTVCAGDFPYMKGGHASGGAVTLLWHSVYGPVLASANTDYSLREPHNQQLTRKKKLQGSLCPRLEAARDETLYSQVYDFGANVVSDSFPDRTVIRVSGTLCDIAHQPSPEKETYSLEYTLGEEGLCVKGGVAPGCEKAAFVLPVVCPQERPVLISGRRALIDGTIRVSSSSGIEYAGPVFNLAPGFEAAELVIRPDADGRFDFLISAE